MKREGLLAVPPPCAKNISPLMNVRVKAVLHKCMKNVCFLSFGIAPVTGSLNLLLIAKKKKKYIVHRILKKHKRRKWLHPVLLNNTGGGRVKSAHELYSSGTRSCSGSLTTSTTSSCVLEFAVQRAAELHFNTVLAQRSLLI